MDLRFFEIYRNPDYLWILAEGAALSAGLTVTAGLAGLCLAIALATARFQNIPVLGHLAAGYVEFIRNTPLIVQLFFVAFGLPQLLGYAWPFWCHALLALTLNFSAYFSEILRAGFSTVAQGQFEAARALGMRPFLIFRKIVLPQAIARMFPSLSGQFVFLFLTTGVIAEIGVNDLTQAGKFIDSRTFRSFEVFLSLTVIYVAMSLTFKSALAVAHRRLYPGMAAR